MKKKVSVIIPFYSNIIWLEEALNSVLYQTFKDYEIIVINDGSPENDKEFLDKYSEKINYFKTENKGPGHARNFGIKKAVGEYIAFLDSDDIWLPTKLEKQINYMIDNNSVWSHTNYYTFDDSNKIIVKYNGLEKYSGNIYPEILASTHIATPSVIVKKSILVDNSLYFSEKMRFGQDYYLWLRLAYLFKLDLFSEYLLKVRVRGTNAAIRARAHIQLRADIYSLLKKDFVFTEAPFSIIFRFNYKICSLLNKLLSCNENKFDVKTIENISKILYIFPYFIFKLIYTITFIKKSIQKVK